MTLKPKYVFLGTPEFAAAVLERLIHAGMPPIAVVTNPDRPVGRKKVLTPPPVKVLTESHHDLGIRVIQPETLKGFAAALSDLKPDVCIVAAYGRIIPPDVLAVPRLGTIGVHPSLLPKHRGASPIQAAILHGDTKTGVTLFLVDARVDHGELISSEEYPLHGEETYGVLEQALAVRGADLLIRVLPEFVAGKIVPAEQDESRATFTKKFTTEDGFITWSDIEAALEGGPLAVMIDRKVRALNPEPGVFTLSPSKGGLRRMKILETKIETGKLILKTVQHEGKTPRPFV